MAIETKKPETIGNVGGAQASPKAMQANKPEPEPLQKPTGGIIEKDGHRMVVRSLAELLQEEKPKKVLILAGYTDGGYKEGYGNVAGMVSNACSGSGVQTEIMHVRPLKEIMESVEKKILAMEELQKSETLVPTEKLSDALKMQDADLVLHLPGCLCCYPYGYCNGMYEKLVTKFGNGKVFIFSPSMEHLDKHWGSVACVVRETIPKSPAPENDYAGACMQLITDMFGKEVASFAESRGSLKKLEETVMASIIAYQRSLELNKFLEKAFFVI